MTEDPFLFIGALFSQKEIYDSVRHKLLANFGSFFLETPSTPWNFTEYYSRELGSPLFRRFIFFDKIITHDSLVEAKLITCSLELLLSSGDKRQINLDPGYMTLAKVVLASTKNYSHRIYLGKGIYGELALTYSRGKFNPLPYAYRDYRDETYLKIFMKARTILRNISTRERSDS